MLLLMAKTEWASLARRYVRHALRTSLVDSSKRHDYRVVLKFLSPTQLGALHVSFSLSQTRTFQNLPQNWLSFLSFTNKKSLVPGKELYSAAENVRMRFRICGRSQNVGGDVQIVQSEHIVFCIITFLNHSYVIGRVGQNDVHPSNRIISHTKPVLLCLIYEVYIINKACRSHLFKKNAHCYIRSFSQSRNRSGMNFIDHIFLFHIMGTYKSSCYSGSFLFSFSSTLPAHKLCFVYQTQNTSYPVWAELIRFQKTAAINSIKKASATSKYNCIRTFSSLSNAGQFEL